MQIPLNTFMNGIEVFILVFIRMSGLFIIAPIFGRRNIPAYYKIGFSALLALILVNTITVPVNDDYSNIYGYTFLVVKEFVVGLTIGFAAYIVFSGIYIAGQLIDMQIGFGMVNVLDPLSNIQVSVTTNFYFIISMLIFLSVNGHHLLIQALFDSYKWIPLGGAVYNNNLLNDIIKVTGNMFLIGFKIAAPVVAAILVSDLALGIISRTVPQLNVFVVGMPLKIVLGIAVIIITIPAFAGFIHTLVREMDQGTLNFIKDMGLKK